MPSPNPQDLEEFIRQIGLILHDVQTQGKSIARALEEIHKMAEVFFENKEE